MSDVPMQPWLGERSSSGYSMTQSGAKASEIDPVAARRRERILAQRFVNLLNVNTYDLTRHELTCPNRRSVFRAPSSRVVHCACERFTNDLSTIKSCSSMVRGLRVHHAQHARGLLRDVRVVQAALLEDFILGARGFGDPVHGHLLDREGIARIGARLGDC